MILITTNTIRDVIAEQLVMLNHYVTMDGLVHIDNIAKVIMDPNSFIQIKDSELERRLYEDFKLGR